MSQDENKVVNLQSKIIHKEVIHIFFATQ